MASPAASDRPEIEVRRSRRRRRTVSAYREGERIVVLIPASLSQGRGGRVGRHHDRPPGALRATPSAHRRRPDGPGGAAERRLPRRPRPAGLGALGRQPAVALGVLHAERPHDPALVAAAAACRRGWSTTCSSTSWPTCSRPSHNEAFWAWVDALPAGRARQGLPRWATPRPPTSSRRRPPTRGDAQRTTSAARAAEISRCISSSRSGSASTGHQRTSRDSSLTVCSAVRCRGRRRTARRGGGRRPRRRRTAPRARRGAPAPGRVRSSVSPDSSRGLPQRGAGRGWCRRARSARRRRTSGAPCGAGSAAPTGRRRRARRVPAVRWSGRQPRVQPVGVRPRCATKRSRSSACAALGRAPPRQHGEGVGVEGRSLLGGRVGGPGPAVEAALEQVAAARRRSRRADSSVGGAGVLAEAERVVEVGGGRQQVRGCIQTPSRASVPWRVRSEPHRVEASRSRRGRSSSPTREAKVCSAGPPAARRRRTASWPAWSRRASARRWPGRRPRRPSPRPGRASTSRRSSAACWAGVCFGLEQTALRMASWIAAGFVGSMPRICSSMRGRCRSRCRGVVGHGADQVVAQPRHVGEEPLVGRLAQREVEQDVVLGDVEPLGERRDVGRHQRRLAGRAERQPDVGGGEHLAGQRRRGRADLGGDHRAGGLAEHAEQRAGHRRGPPRAALRPWRR